MSDTARVTFRAIEPPSRQSGEDEISGFMAWRLGPIIPNYPIEDLSLYEPRWVWAPSFRHTEAYRRVLESVKQAGLFRPLLILPDGRTIDGQHRYLCAKENGLENVPVRIVDVPLSLSAVDRLAIEDWAVCDAIAWRHLTKAQATEMLYDLLRGRTEAQAETARLANLRRGNEKRGHRPDPSHPTLKELGGRAGKSQRSVERAVTVVRHAPPEIQAQVRNGRLTLGGAERVMKAARAAGNDAGATVTAAADPPPKTAAVAVARAEDHSIGAGTAVTGSTHQATSSASLPLPDVRSESARVVETFVEAARTLVREARVWDRGPIEQLAHALGQIETSLRDASAKARDEHHADE